MEIFKIHNEVRELIEHLDMRALKIDEKFAVLEATQGLLKAVISAETLQAMTANYLKGGR